MKKIIQSLALITLMGCIIFTGCKKEKPVSSVVSPPPPPPPAPPANINLHLTFFDTLSKARYNIVTGAAGSKILFAGGMYGEDCFVPGGDYGDSIASVCLSESTKVDIYDTITHSWSTHELVRYYVGTSTVTMGNKIFFAGGVDTADREWSDKVDVYDASTNSWSIIQLSEPRAGLAVASHGNKVFFAGGVKSLGFQNVVVSNKVDIYDISSNSWSTTTLSEARTGIAATTAGDKVIFAGGNYFGWWPVSNRIDIYNATTNTWSTASLSEARSGSAAGTISNRAFFAGGITGFNTPNSHKVDIYDNSTSAWSVEEVNIWGIYLNAVTLNNKLLILYGKYGNMYNALTNSWSVVTLDQELGWPGIIPVGDYVYFAGGQVSYAQGYQTNTVWRVKL
jgi:hypothetical protein